MPPAADPGVADGDGARTSGRDADDGPRSRRPSRLRGWLTAHPDALATVLLAALIAAVCFTVGGGSLARATWPQVALTALGALVVGIATLVAPSGRRLWGGVTLLLFGALAALTAVSISWSIQPSDSWTATNQTLSYLAVFAASAAVVRIAPQRWRAVLGGIVLATVVVCGYGLLTKVFPGWATANVGRLRAPFDYWNAVGLMAVLGMPGCLWLGARRDGHAALRALAVPALTVLLCAMLLSYGRGALAVGVVVVALWFVLVPLRLRSAAVLIAAAAGAAIIAPWAFDNQSLTADRLPLDVRVDAGHDLGLLLIAVAIVATAAGLALAFATSREPLSPQRRQGIGAVLLVLVALVPIAAVGRLATSDRGLGGSISHNWDQLTDPNATQPGNDPGRFGSAGSMRARYWDDALQIWKWDRLKGVGADTYGTARRPIQPDKFRADHAHGYIPQTLADLGLLGLGLNLLLLVAWLGAAARATALKPPWRIGAWAVAAARARTAKVPVPRREPQPWSPERIGLATIALSAVAFGLHSAVDWTWFIHGTAVIGMICAGWVAARGPLTDPLPPLRPLRRAIADLPRLALAATVVLAGLVAAWTTWQPLRAQEANFTAIEALGDGRIAQARADARRAIDLNPLSIDGRLTLADVEQADGRAAEALALAQRAVRLQPANRDTWLALGQLLLQQGDAARAVTAFQAAVFLDPQSPGTQALLADAQAQAGVVPTAPPAAGTTTPPAPGATTPPAAGTTPPATGGTTTPPAAGGATPPATP